MPLYSFTYHDSSPMQNLTKPSNLFSILASINDVPVNLKNLQKHIIDTTNVKANNLPNQLARQLAP